MLLHTMMPFWQVRRELQEVKERAAAITASTGEDVDEYETLKEVAPVP